MRIRPSSISAGRSRRSLSPAAALTLSLLLPPTSVGCWSPAHHFSAAGRTILLALCAIITVALACSPVPVSSGSEPVQSRCALTYAAGAPRYVFTAGANTTVYGEILADGECQGVTQTLREPLPDGLTFTTGWGGRWWTISGTPTETMAATAYTIDATAEFGRGGFRSTSKTITIVVVE